MFTADFDGILRVGCWLLGLIVFVIYYMRSYKNWGVVTVATYRLGFTVFLPVFVMFPFTFMPENIKSTGDSYFTIVYYLDKAFYLTMLGLLFMVFGMLIPSANKPNSRLLDALKNAFTFWNSTTGILCSIGILSLMTVLVLSMGVELFHGRDFAFANTDKRPLINLYMVLISTLALNILVFSFVKKSLLYFSVGLCACGLGLLVGTRGASIMVLMNAVVILMIIHRYKNLTMVIPAALIFFLLAVVISIFRTGGSLGEFRIQEMLWDQFFFGNNLSDLRDYAWILSGFEGDFFYGKTYLAGYLSFIPSSLSDFRNTYSIGRITPALAGLTPELHAGLRPTQFGEAYLNFGYLGIAFFGLFFGYWLQKIQTWAHHTLNTDHQSHIKILVSFIALTILSSFVFTPSFFNVYVLLALILTGTIARKYVKIS